MPSKRKKTAFAMSRRKRSAIFVLFILFFAALFWLDHSPVKDIWQSPPESEGRTAYDFQKYHGKTFTVTKVVDGDTIYIDVPDGEDNHTRIRLWGVDTPETKHPAKGVMYFGPEAAEFTTNLALGKRVTVYLDEGNNTRGNFGRLLAYVKLPDGKFLNEVLLKEGFAYADTRFRHSSFYKYKQLESAAKNAKKGLWKNVQPDQMPHWRQ